MEKENNMLEVEAMFYFMKESLYMEKKMEKEKNMIIVIIMYHLKEIISMIKEMEKEKNIIILIIILN